MTGVMERNEASLRRYQQRGRTLGSFPSDVTNSLETAFPSSSQQPRKFPSRKGEGVILVMLFLNRTALFEGSFDELILNLMPPLIHIVYFLQRGHTQAVRGLCVANDLVYTGGEDGVLREWDLATGNTKP